MISMPPVTKDAFSVSRTLRHLVADVCAIVALLAVFLAMWVH
jgi:hypothetical protein